MRARGRFADTFSAEESARADFSTTGAELVAAFDGPTDKASATTGARFPCAEVLDFDGADRSTCYWIDARSVNADVASAAVVPGGNVTLAAGAVRRACDAGAERCDCDRPANASSAPAAPPDPPLVPVALLDGPTTAAVCEGVVVGSSQSTGSGGRPFAYAYAEGKKNQKEDADKNAQYRWKELPPPRGGGAKAPARKPKPAPKTRAPPAPTAAPKKRRAPQPAPRAAAKKRRWGPDEHPLAGM